jgi:hypothetical protein
MMLGVQLFQRLAPLPAVVGLNAVDLNYWSGYFGAGAASEFQVSRKIIHFPYLR